MEPNSPPPSLPAAAEGGVFHALSPLTVAATTFAEPVAPKSNSTRRVLAFEFGHGFGPLGGGPAAPQSPQNIQNGPASAPPTATTLDEEGMPGGGSGEKKKKKKKKKGKDGADGAAAAVHLTGTKEELPVLVSFKAPGKPNRGVLVPPLNFGMASGAFSRRLITLISRRPRRSCASFRFGAVRCGAVVADARALCLLR